MYKDLEPYLDEIIPGLKNTLLDPTPVVRSHAAKALGAMVKGASEKTVESLLNWLMETLTSEQSPIDRLIIMVVFVHKYKTQVF